MRVPVGTGSFDSLEYMEVPLALKANGINFPEMLFNLIFFLFNVKLCLHCLSSGLVQGISGIIKGWNYKPGVSRLSSL